MKQLKSVPYAITLSLYQEAEGMSYGVNWYVKEVVSQGKGDMAEGRSTTEGRNTTEAQSTTEEHSTSEEWYVEVVSLQGKTIARIPGTPHTWKEYTFYQAVIRNLTPDTVYQWRIVGSKGGAGEVFSLRTPEKGKEEFTFLHITDTQNDEGFLPKEYYHRLLRGAYEDGPVDFILHTGDVVQLGRDDKLWEEMLGDSLLSSTPVMAISGNHDYWPNYGLKDGYNETTRHFHLALPPQETVDGCYYAFDYGCVHFICLSCEDMWQEERWEKQLDWLRSQLHESKGTWTILAVHAPFFSLGKYGSMEGRNADSKKLRQDISPLIAGKVDLVLQGHDHVVQYTYPLDGTGAVLNADSTKTKNAQNEECREYALHGGTVYLMSGQGGNQNRNGEFFPELAEKFAYYPQKDELFFVWDDKTPTYAQISVTGERLSVRLLAMPEGERRPKLINACSFVK